MRGIFFKYDSMNFKYLVMIGLVVVLVTPISRAEGVDLPDPGITPDSPFYFLDKWGEGLGRLFAFRAKTKATRQIKYAEERLAEAQQMMEKDKMDLAKSSVEEYGKLMDEATAGLVDEAQNGKDVEETVVELVAGATSKHQEVLAKVYEKVPEEAKPAIEQAMIRSTQGQERAIETLPTERREAVREQTREQFQNQEQTRNQVEESVVVPGVVSPGSAAPFRMKAVPNE
jgi:hypothetical protein